MDTTFIIDPLAVSVLVGTVLPILVGLVTKLGAPSGLKSVLLLFFAAVQGLIVNATVADGVAVLSSESLLVAAIGWVTAVASYYGLLKPTGLAGQVNQRTANFGISGRSS